MRPHVAATRFRADGTLPKRSVARWCSSAMAVNMRHAAPSRSIASPEIDECVFMCIIHTMKSADLIRMLKADGWKLVHTVGSHHQFRHPTKPGRVTVHGKSSDNIAPGTLNSIMKQSGLKK